MTPSETGYAFHSSSLVAISFSSARRRSSQVSVTLSWENVSVFVKESHNGCKEFFCCQSSETIEKQILHNVNGIVKPGSLLAILGASGAGKSTLLNVLNQRNVRTLKVTGDLRVNGIKLDREIATLSGYVQQIDLFIGRLTVRESIWFHAMLRMSRNCSNEERTKRIEEVIQQFSLGKCANTQIGIPGRIVGISGGERKRLALACEVLTNPFLLFCDEPTSGLDSFMAENVVRSLQTMASEGKTVICTIHQPSSQVYALFDKILLMAEGRVAYMGTTAELPDFFGSIGIHCPPSFNPADYYVHALAVVPGREEARRAEIRVVCDAYEKSPQFDKMKIDLQRVLSPTRKSDLTEKTTKKPSLYRTSLWTEFWVLMWRSFATVLREPILTRTKIITNAVIAVVIGLLYLNQSYDQQGVMNINGALFILQTHLTLGSVYPVVNTFIFEFPVFKREHHNGVYRSGPYYLSKMLAEMPIYIVTPIIFSSIAYWMIGLHNDLTTFLIAVGTLLLVCNCAVSFGYVMSCTSSNLDLILSVYPMILIRLLLVGGLLLNAGSIPVYFIWLRYISWFRYSNEILVVNQWRYVRSIHCDVPFRNTSIGAQSLQSSSCFTDGRAVIKSLSFSEDNLLFDFLMLAALVILFRFISYTLLYLRSRLRD